MKKRIVCIIVVGLSLLYFTGPTFAAGQRGEVVEIKAVKVTDPPKLDGKLDDRAWLEAALYGSKLSGFVDALGTKLVSYQTVAFVAYDDKNLYLAVQCYTPDVDKLQAKGKPGEFFWGDDLIQVFLEPNLDARYVHYGINCQGVKTTDIISATTSIGKISWTLELAIPWEKIRFIPEEGKLIGFNIAGQASCHEVSAKTGWITWAATYGGFHNPSRFGYLLLGSKLPVRKIPTTIEEDDF